MKKVINLMKKAAKSYFNAYAKLYSNEYFNVNL